MALRPIDRYPAQVDTDAAYPHGKARNAGSFQDGTGTPYEKDIINDTLGFHQGLLLAAGITPSGDPDSATVSQYVDAVRAVSVDATSLRNLRRALMLRPVSLLGLSYSSSLFGGVVSTPDGSSTLYVKGGTNGAITIMDTPYAGGGAATGVTEVRVLLRAGTRIIAAGAGGAGNAFSTTVGTSWTNGGASGLSIVQQGVWDGTEFILSDEAGKSAHSTTGVSWANVTGDDLSDVFDLIPSRGMAALSNGDVIAAGTLVDNTQAFAISSDHGASWASVGSIPSSDYVVAGYLAGNGGTEIYWLGKPAAADRLDLWVSTDGASWEKRAEIPGFDATALPPRLFMCKDTGLLLAAHDDGTTMRVSASVDGGRSWTEPVYYQIPTLTMIAVANGRVFGFASGSGDLFALASDRL
jgi:hypothetical protein